MFFSKGCRQVGHKSAGDIHYRLFTTAWCRYAAQITTSKIHVYLFELNSI